MGVVLTLQKFLPIRSNLKIEHKSLVFTNGVFDILHRGHVEYLMKARELGDTLIIGVNSDSSVKRIKGDKRPIVTADDRMFLLSHLDCVEYVVSFDEDTPFQLIQAIVPDVLVKGADWAIEHVVGRDVVEAAGGMVKTIDFVPDRSTTGIVERILERYR